MNEWTIGGILCDLDRAFECGNHDILLSELEFYRIVCKVYTLTKSYSNDRYQRVLRDNTNYNSILPDRAKSNPVFCLFFILYITELLKIIMDISQPVLFTNGTNILISKTSPTEFTNCINKGFVNTLTSSKVIYYHWTLMKHIMHNLWPNTVIKLT
jgi:hypothetical protein